MKTRLTYFSVIFLFLFTACEKNTDLQTMMQNSESRGQMMQNILDDNVMMSEFLSKMRLNQSALLMIQSDHEIMQMIIKGNEMHMANNNLLNDRDIMNGMMQSIIKDGEIMNQMVQMMYKEGFISDDCMNYNIQMMKNKGNLDIN